MTRDSASVDSTSMLDSDYRAFWWNDDFIELLASRLGLADATNVLDVGCGVGHWSATLAPHLSRASRLIGVDATETLLARARSRLTDFFPADRLELHHARAERLPFDDESFDFVTCQTLLIHLADPLAAVREMRRVTRHGGTILAVEPHILAHQVVPHTHSPVEVEYWIERVHFFLTCMRGREALGHGNFLVGERVPNFLREAGFAEVRGWLSDKVTLVTPPYDDDEGASLINSIRDLHERAAYPFPREVGRRYYVAGGGAPEEFDSAWKRRRDDQAAFLQLCDEGIGSATVSQLLYLVAGRALT